MAMPRLLGSRWVTSAPSISMMPASVSSRPAMAFSSVDLPQPDGPSSTVKSPASIGRLMFFRTCRGPKDLNSPETETANIYPLNATGRDAAHEVASRDEIDQQRRQGRQQCRRRVHVVFDHAGRGRRDGVE